MKKFSIIASLVYFSLQGAANTPNPAPWYLILHQISLQEVSPSKPPARTPYASYALDGALLTSGIIVPVSIYCASLDLYGIHIGTPRGYHNESLHNLAVAMSVTFLSLFGIKKSLDYDKPKIAATVLIAPLALAAVGLWRLCTRMSL